MHGAILTQISSGATHLYLISSIKPLESISTYVHTCPNTNDSAVHNAASTTLKSTDLHSVNTSLRKQDELCERITAILPNAPVGESSTKPSDEFLDEFEKWVDDLLNCTPLEEACVLDNVLGWAQLKAPDAGNWMLQYLKGEVEHQSLLLESGKSAECVLFAIPVLFPLKSVYDNRLVGEEGLEVIQASLKESHLLSDMSQCVIAGSMLSYENLSGRSFGELKRLAHDLATQHAVDGEPVLQIPSWFYADEAPAVNDWARSFNVDIRFIIGIASAPYDMLPGLFTLAKEEEAFDVPLKELPPQAGVMPSGMLWEELMTKQLAYSTVADMIPLRVCEPLPLYSAVESSLELARQLVVQMTVIELEEKHGLRRDSLGAGIEPHCMFQNGEPSHINVHLHPRQSAAQRVLTIRWPILPHEYGIDEAAEELFRTLDLCNLELMCNSLGQPPSVEGLTVH